MKLREVMTNPVIRIHPDETVSVAARTLQHYNIGILPVCGMDGKVCGLVTDRDLVVRCLAAGKSPATTPVRDVMTAQIVTARPDMDAATAASLMGSRQIRRLPVVEGRRLVGMVSLGDLSHMEETSMEAAEALSEITANVRHW